MHRFYWSNDHFSSDSAAFMVGGLGGLGGCERLGTERLKVLCMKGTIFDTSYSAGGRA